MVAEAARGDGDLVGGQLPVLLGVLRRRLAGLEVDDDQPAVGVALQPVDLAPDERPADGGVELDLDADQLAAVGGVPGEEPVEHVLRRLPLPLVGPARPEVELVELGGQHGRGVRRRQPLGDLLGDGVHRRARPCASVSGDASAPTALSTHRSGQRWKVSIADGRTRTGSSSGTSGASSDSGASPHQLGGRGARHALVGEPAEHRRGGGPALRRGVRIGERAAQVGHQRRAASGIGAAR